MLLGLVQDFRHAVRALSASRSFTIVCVVSLGIGMAPVIVVPYATRAAGIAPPLLNTDGLVEVVTTRQGPHAPTSNWSYPDFVDLRDADTGMTLVGWINGQVDMRAETPSGPQRARVYPMFVTANYFETVGVPLARGGGFSANGGGRAAVLTYDFWKSRLASDPDAVGKTIDLDGASYVIAGITPESFRGHLGMQGTGLFLPLEQHPSFVDVKKRTDRGDRWVNIHARLSPGTSLEQANASVAALTPRLASQYPATNEFTAGTVLPYFPVGSLTRPELAVFETVVLTLTGTILFIVCLNISGMMRVRGALRERDLSIRQALGASRAALVRYLLAESIVLAALGSLLASTVLFSLPPFIAWFAGRPLPYELTQALRVDPTIIGMCALLCLTASVVFGLLPALRFSRPAILSSIKDDAGTGSARAGRVHRVTAALQVAIAVPLVVMGGVSLDRVRATAMADLGFDAERIYTAPLKVTADSAIGFQIRSAEADLAKIDGVEAVTVADGLPLDFRSRSQRVSFTPGEGQASRERTVQITRVGEGYFDAMGIRLVRGRGFTPADDAGAPLVMVISEPLAAELFPDEDAAAALGRTLMYGADPRTQKALTIVGVTHDFPTSQMSNPRAQALLPLAQHADLVRDSAPIGSDTDETPRLLLIARSRSGEQAAKMTAAIEKVARDRNPDFEPTAIVTGAWLRKNSMNDFLTQSAVAGVAGGVILTLSALGIYGVIGLMVASRTREIAVRIALGATRRRVIGMILFDVVKLVTPGIAVGLILTVALNRLNAENMGIPLSGIENIAYVAGAAIAILVAVLASLAPARRAASVHPMVAMRSL